MITPATMTMTPTVETAPPAEAAEFVERFRKFWASPHTVPLSTILAPDVRLVQPLTRSIFGLPAAEGWRRRLFTAMPNLRTQVDGWCASGDLLFIAFRLRAVEPTYQLEWPAVDRFRLRAGLALERVTYFDGLLLLRQIARQPRTWPRFLRWASSEWQADTGSGTSGT
jgi:hypothetical protein